ncbi:MAG: ABC transporter permease subunit [Spirochaetaceae bacterium]|nr:ABC transporter permease subunit [Spirochaetaceae bacterium]
MKPALALAKKELYALSLSPLLYGAAVFFVLFVSIWLFYFQRFFALDSASLRPFFAAFPLVFILVVPVITMKAWAEERKIGTYEALLTLPFSEWDMVLGKFFSSFCAVMGMVVLTIPVPLTVLPLGHFDAGVIISEYLGVLLLAASSTSLGLLLSSMAKNQGGAFLGSAVVLLVVMLISQVTQTLNLPLMLASVLNFFSLSFHFESFSKGILDSRDLAFFVLTTALFLLLNTKILIFRKWS